MRNKSNYKHINGVERKEIALLLEKGYSIRDVARTQGRSPSSISEEISKNSVKGRYDPEKADRKARTRRKQSKYQGMKVRENELLSKYVTEKIKEDWSPEEIAGRIKKIDHHIPYASRGAIYKYISSAWGCALEKYLRYQRGGRKRSEQKASKLEDRTFIDKRPKIIEKRRRFGDWEGDFIVSGKSGKGALLVLHERKSRYVLIKRILDLTIENVHRYIFELTGGVIMNTLTLDNDIVFKKHKELSALLGVNVYFCHPYHSWEKGGVENSNKLIRQYVPKRSDISAYSDEYVQIIQDKLNNRPRKCLAYKTPLEVMRENNQLRYEVGAMIKMFKESQKQKMPSVRLEG